MALVQFETVNVNQLDQKKPQDAKCEQLHCVCAKQLRAKHSDLASWATSQQVHVDSILVVKCFCILPERPAETGRLRLPTSFEDPLLVLPLPMARG